MSPEIFWQRTLEHLVYSAIPIAIGAALAWPVSSWVVGVLDRETQDLSSLSRTIFPWRAIVVTLVVMFLPFMPLNFVLGLGMEFYVTGMSLASFVIGVVLLANARSTRAERDTGTTRRIASLRTLATIVAALSIPGYRWLGVGAEWLLAMGRERPELRTMWAGIFVVAIVALVFDLVLGYLQYRMREPEAPITAPANEPGT